MSHQSSTTIKVPKAGELVANLLRRRIIKGDIKPGEPLPSENELMAIFNVSRPTLREALRILDSESLITVARGARGGARANLPDVDVTARYATIYLQAHGTTFLDLHRARQQLLRARVDEALARVEMGRASGALAETLLAVKK